MKKIIVATDFSPEAENALEYCIAAAKEHNFELVLFHLYTVSVHPLNARASGQSLDTIFRHVNNQLRNKAQVISKAHGIPVDPYMASGDFLIELKRCLVIHFGGIVVMGMAARSLEQDLLGNTTTAAISQMSFAVLAIPINAKYTGIKNILFACDISRGVHKKVLDQVVSVSQGFEAFVEVFHVRNKMDDLKHRKINEEHLKSVQQDLSGINYWYQDVESGEIIDAIRTEILRTGADLLIMVPYKHGFWNSLVHRSKTKIMASGNDIPLLSLPL